jgi:type I restriction enzyme M protein
MTMLSKQIVDRAWAFAHVLRDDGLSYMAYTEQITFLLFLKMAHEVADRHPERPNLVPRKLAWPTLLQKEGKELIKHYEYILESLSRKGGMLGAIFHKPRPDIQNPSTLRKLIVELIEPVDWSSFEADVKGNIYEGILARTAEESPKGAGQYFTPRELIQAIVDCVRPTPGDTVCDPAAGTGGFLLGARDYVIKHYGNKLSESQRQHLSQKFVRGWELVPNTARLCVMNLYLHGVEADLSPIEIGVDSLSMDPKERFTLVLTNPPFGRKSTVGVGGGGAAITDGDDQTYRRAGFWAATKNKQLSFLQHAKSLLAERGRCAIVIPDNILFEGGAGERVRRALLDQFDVHTLLRLPTGIFYAQGVKSNVLFFEAKPRRRGPATSQLWVYDLRTSMRFTLRTKSLRRSDLDEFVACYRSPVRSRAKARWDAVENPRGRWRAFGYPELVAREKANLDLVWLAGESDERSRAFSPDQLAQAIIDDLQIAISRFQSISHRLRPD